MRKIIFYCLLLALPFTGVQACLASAPPSAAASSNAVTPVNRIVAIVNNQVVTQTQLDQQINIIKTQLAHQHTPLPPQKILTQQVLNQLINRDIQLQLAKQNNIQINSQQLTAAIQHLAQAHQTTVANVYKQGKASGLDRQQLRQQIQHDLIIQKLQQDAMASHITITPEEINSYLEALANNPHTKKEFHVQDILVSLPAAPTPAQVDAAKLQAAKVMQKFYQGTNFQQLAVAHSGGQHALQGGDLGWRKYSELPAAFASKVVQLKKGQIAGPIRTPNGFHIIRLAGERGLAPSQKMEEIQLQEIMLQPTAKMPAANIMNTLNKLRLEVENGGDFTALAKQYSKAASASKGGILGWAKLGAYPQAIQTAIKSLKPGELSHVIKVGAHQYYLLKLLAQREEPLSTQAQRDQAQEVLFQQKMLESLQTWINQLRSQAYVKIMDAPQ